jgi:hypothetical protein
MFWNYSELLIQVTETDFNETELRTLILLNLILVGTAEFAIKFTHTLLTTPEAYSKEYGLKILLIDLFWHRMSFPSQKAIRDSIITYSSRKSIFKTIG